MIKTITLNGLTPVTIKESAFDMARFCWIKNTSGSDVYASCTDPQCTAKGNGVKCISAGESGMLDAESYETLYLSGSGEVYIETTPFTVCPFKINSKGGDIKSKNGESSYTITDAVDFPVLGLNLYGKSTQDGVPTPENPVEIVSVGDSGSVGVAAFGKNLLDISNSINETNFISDVSNGVITFNKTKKSWSSTYIGKFYYKKGSEITLSSWNKIPFGRFGFSRYFNRYPDSNGIIYTLNGNTTFDLLRSNRQKITLELDYDGIIYIWYCSDINYNTSTENEFSTTLQVEIGGTATDYEPYKSNTANITTALPLCGLPVSEDGNYTDSDGQQWICDMLRYNADGSGKFIKWTAKIDGYNGESIATPYISTTGDLTTGATVIYQLAEPQEIPLSAAEMAELRQLQTYSGVTNITNSDSADMDVKYCTNKLMAEYYPAFAEKEKYFIYNNGQELNGNTLTVHHKSSQSGKQSAWTYLYYYYGGVITTSKLPMKGYKRIGISVMLNRNNSYTPFYTWLSIRDSGMTELSGNDYLAKGNIISEKLTPIDNSVDSNINAAGGIYYIDIPKDIDNGYLVINSVNVDVYLLSIWLE